MTANDMVQDKRLTIQFEGIKVTYKVANFWEETTIINTLASALKPLQGVSIIEVDQRPDESRG